MTSRELQNALETVGKRFDFGEYEIEAYLTILEHGRLTAAEIAESTEIPQPRVYDTVRSLAENGLVELRQSRPMQVLAINPEEAFDTIQTSLDDLVEQLEKSYTAPARDAEAVTLVKSRSTILRYLGEVITSAEYELILSLTPDLVARFGDELRDRRAAGVNIELLLSPASDAPSADEYAYSDIATTVRTRRGVTTPIVAVSDGTYSVYTTQDGLGGNPNRYGVIFNRSELGFLISGFLNTSVWTTATTLLEKSDDLSFPRRYATIRRCVDDLQATGGEFFATISGRDVLNGSSKTIRGKVVDISVGTNREFAALTIETDAGFVDVGGQVAALEDIEAHEIRIDRNEPPALE